jgi:two-component system response regulator PilR (NtrC family)
MSGDKPLALIIDDEPDLLSLLAISLGRMGINTVKASTIKDAIETLGTSKFDLCFTDLRLPDGNGIEIVKHIQKHHLNTPIAVITAFGEPETAVHALKSGAFDYVCKPIEVEAIENMVTNALRASNQAWPESGRISDQTKEPMLQLTGESESINSVRKMITKVAVNQAPVHISGETGTGKERIARLIHSTGPRAQFDFVAVNCGAIPRELMESQFFGHKKGSFTGAYSDSEGLFQAANGGTLFLDEVGELPNDLQAKLLRVIQEKKVRAVGGTRETLIDVRLISATHNNLDEMVQSGSFREDFYYRINVIPIVASPLRDRKEDIPILVEEILKKLCKANNVESTTLDEKALLMLKNYHYPGNIRELENILERTLALVEYNIIKISDISLPDAYSKPESIQQNDFELQKLPLDEHVASVEMERITRALEESGGNITAAAGILGTTFRSLRYRIKKLGIETEKTPIGDYRQL